jgi:hypothetical protein
VSTSLDAAATETAFQMSWTCSSRITRIWSFTVIVVAVVEFRFVRAATTPARPVRSTPAYAGDRLQDPDGNYGCTVSATDDVQVQVAARTLSGEDPWGSAGAGQACRGSPVPGTVEPDPVGADLVGADLGVDPVGAGLVNADLVGADPVDAGPVDADPAGASYFRVASRALACR